MEHHQPYEMEWTVSFSCNEKEIKDNEIQKQNQLNLSKYDTRSINVYLKFHLNIRTWNSK